MSKCPVCDGSGQILFGRAGWQRCPYCIEFQGGIYNFPPGYVNDARFAQNEEAIGKAWFKRFFESSTVHEHDVYVPPPLQLFPQQEQHLGHALRAIERPRQHAKPLPPVGRVRHFTTGAFWRHGSTHFFRTGPQTHWRRHQAQLAFIEALPALKRQQVAREKAKTRLFVMFCCFVALLTLGMVALLIHLILVYL